MQPISYQIYRKFARAFYLDIINKIMVLRNLVLGSEESVLHSKNVMPTIMLIMMKVMLRIIENIAFNM